MTPADKHRTAASEQTAINLHDHDKCKACYQTEAALSTANARLERLRELARAAMKNRLVTNNADEALRAELEKE